MSDVVQALIGGRDVADEWEVLRERFIDSRCWDCGGVGQQFRFVHIEALGYIERPLIPIVAGADSCGSCEGRGRIVSDPHLISEEELP